MHMRNRYFHIAPTILHCRKTCIDVIKEIQIIAVMYSFVKSRMIISITIVSTKAIDITIAFSVWILSVVPIVTLKNILWQQMKRR